MVGVQRWHRTVTDLFQEPFETGAVAGLGKFFDGLQRVGRFDVGSESSASSAQPSARGCSPTTHTLVTAATTAGNRAQVSTQFRGVNTPCARALETFCGQQVPAPVTRTPQRLRVRGRDRASTGYGHCGHHADDRLTVSLVTDEHVFGVWRTTVGHHGHLRVQGPELATARPAYFKRVGVQHGGRLKSGSVIVTVARRPQAQPVKHECGHVYGVRTVQRRIQSIVQVRL